jgi:heme oxygenase
MTLLVDRHPVGLRRDTSIPAHENSRSVRHQPVNDMAQLSRDSFDTLHLSLRAATRSDHTVVDRLVTRLDFSRSEDYGRFLSIHHAVLQNLKAQWRPEDHDDFAAMSRRLQNDMLALDFPAAHPESMSPIPKSEGDSLGIAYVIRGSRLGSTVLRPRIGSRFSTAYFDFAPAVSWADFLAQLRSKSWNPNSEESSAAIRGAKMTFEMFSRLLAQVPVFTL